MDEIFKYDTCNLCNTKRTSKCREDQDGWYCPACNAYNPNGSGINTPPDADFDYVDNENNIVIWPFGTPENEE